MTEEFQSFEQPAPNFLSDLETRMKDRHLEVEKKGMYLDKLFEAGQIDTVQYMEFANTAQEYQKSPAIINPQPPYSPPDPRTSPMGLGAPAGMSLGMPTGALAEIQGQAAETPTVYIRPATLQDATDFYRKYEDQEWAHNALADIADKKQISRAYEWYDDSRWEEIAEEFRKHPNETAVRLGAVSDDEVKQMANIEGIAASSFKGVDDILAAGLMRQAKGALGSQSVARDNLEKRGVVKNLADEIEEVAGDHEVAYGLTAIGTGVTPLGMSGVVGRTMAPAIRAARRATASGAAPLLAGAKAAFGPGITGGMGAGLMLGGVDIAGEMALRPPEERPGLMEAGGRLAGDVAMGGAAEAVLGPLGELAPIAGRAGIRKLESWGPAGHALRDIRAAGGSSWTRPRGYADMEQAHLEGKYPEDLPFAEPMEQISPADIRTAKAGKYFIDQAKRKETLTYKEIDKWNQRNYDSLAGKSADPTPVIDLIERVISKRLPAGRKVTKEEMLDADVLLDNNAIPFVNNKLLVDVWKKLHDVEVVPHTTRPSGKPDNVLQEDWDMMSMGDRYMLTGEAGGPKPVTKLTTFLANKRLTAPQLDEITRGLDIAMGEAYVASKKKPPEVMGQLQAELREVRRKAFGEGWAKVKDEQSKMLEGIANIKNDLDLLDYKKLDSSDPKQVDRARLALYDRLGYSGGEGIELPHGFSDDFKSLIKSSRAGNELIGPLPRKGGEYMEAEFRGRRAPELLAPGELRYGEPEFGAGETWLEEELRQSGGAIGKGVISQKYMRPKRLARFDPAFHQAALFKTDLVFDMLSPFAGVGTPAAYFGTKAATGNKLEQLTKGVSKAPQKEKDTATRLAARVKKERMRGGR